MFAVALVWSNPLPVIVTETPPEIELFAGATAAMVGVTVYCLTSAEPMAKPKPATRTLTVWVPAGRSKTETTSWVSLA